MAQEDAIPAYALLGLVSGLATGLLIIVFRLAIEYPLSLMLPGGNPEHFENLDWELRFLLPLAGAALLAVVLTRLKPMDRLVGVRYVMERLSLHQGHLSFRSILVQFFCGVVTLVSGQSAGREGPAVHLGAACSSLIGQRLKLPNNSIRILVGCGTAAAISASFNTPLAGIIFAMEVVMMEYTIKGFTPIIIASICADSISRLVFGTLKTLPLESYLTFSISEIPYLILIGCIIGISAATFLKTITFMLSFNRFPLAARLMTGGLLTACAAVLVPEVMGLGYDTVRQAMTGHIGMQMLLTIAVTKLMVTAFAVGLGMPSGIIAPTMVMGAVSGALLGTFGTHFLPEWINAPIGFYAIIGMGAMMAAVLNAPLAALLAMVELTSTSAIIMPAMLTIIVANLVCSSLFRQESVFISMLHAQGRNYRNTPLVQALRRAGVYSVLQSNIIRCQQKCTLAQARSALSDKPRWIIIERGNRRKFLLSAPDLAHYLASRDRLGLTDPSARQSGPEHQIDLLEIPGERKRLDKITSQATLEEALVMMQAQRLKALYVEQTDAPYPYNIAGIITLDDIRNYYQ